LLPLCAAAPEAQRGRPFCDSEKPDIRRLLLPLTLLTIAAWGVASRATRVYVNGLPLRESAITKDGVTYVPLRAVAESLGCQVTWDPRLGVQIWSNNPQLPTTPEAPTPGVVPAPRAPVFQPPSPSAPRDNPSAGRIPIP